MTARPPAGVGGLRGARAGAVGLAAAALSSAVLVAACTAGAGDGSVDGDSSPPPGSDAMGDRSITEVQEAHADAWESLEGVVGTGVGRCEGEPCIKVYVREASPSLEEELPERVEGYPVRLEVTGPFRARDTSARG